MTATRPVSTSGQHVPASVQARTTRHALLALAAGLLLFAGHPPLDIGLLGVVAVIPLLALGRQIASRPRPVAYGAWWGLVAGLTFFLPLLAWLVRFGVLAWVLLALVQALSVAAFVAGLAAWGERRGAGLFAVVWWVALEAARSSWPLGGFPWGGLGYTQHAGGPFLPVARAVGVFGVSALLVAVGVALFAAWRRGVHVWRDTPGGTPRGEAAATAAAMPLGVVVVLLVLAVLLGGDPPRETGERVDIAGVQGNDLELPPVIDRDNAPRVEQVTQRMVDATRRLADDPPQVTVWPENALDDDPRTNPRLRELVDEALAVLDGRPLLAGVLLDGPRPRTFRNAIVRFGEDGEIVEAYVKRRLVPFGEYVPFRPLIGDLPPLRQLPSDGVPGDRPEVFDIAGARIGPVTCYESVYGDLVRSQVRAGADVLVVSTNNASFGRTPASRQHLAFSQVRAVETGRWVLHAGISGISAVVSPTGKVSQRTQLFEQEIVRADLPLVAELTPAMRVGDAVPMTAGVLSVVALAWLTFDRVRVARRGAREDAVGDG